MRKAILALVVAMAVVAAWFTLTRNEAPAPPTAGAQAATLTNATPLAEHGAVTGDTAAAPTAQQRNERVAAPASFVGPGADVLVVEFGSNTPIADAEVLCSPPDLDWQKLTPTQRKLFSDDREAALRQLQAPFRSDAAGRCRVPLGKDGTQVIAHHGDRRAEGWIDKGTPQPFVLALRQDRTLRVRVLLADGRPARGLQVMATRERDKRQFGCGITDDEGRAEHHHLQQLAGEEATARLMVRAEFAGGASEPVAVESSDPPAEVLLRLPACGTLVVHVRDIDGKPIDPAMLEDAKVAVTLWSDRPSDRYDENNVAGRAQAPIDANGDATFHALAFGHLLRAQTGHSTKSAMVPGPTAVEPRSELVLQEGASHAICTGVLLTSDGNPYTGVFQLYLRFRHGLVGNGGRTGAAGRFRVALGDSAVGQHATPSFDTLLASRLSGDPAMAAERESLEVTKGINDLGEVRLEPHSVLLQGRFEGDALPERLPLQLQFEVKRGEAWDVEWNLQPVWSGHSFTVSSGIRPGTPARLKVNTTSFLPIAPIEFSAGATDVRIPLRLGGEVSAWFLVDAGVPTDGLRIQLRAVDAPPPDASRQFDDQHRWQGSEPIDGKLGRSWTGLAPGRYRLEARAPGAAQPLAVVDAIDVSDGPCKDERLQAIDLRGRLRTVTVRATSPDGSAIASRDAFVIVRDGDVWTGHNLGNGEVLLTAAGPLDLLVSAPRHEMATLDGVFESRTVALAAATPTTLVIAWPEPVPAGTTASLDARWDTKVPRRARLTLDTGRGMPAETWFEESAEVGADGRVTLPGRFPGEHRLRLLLRSANEGASLELSPAKITLPARAEVPVRIEPPSWNRAMQRLRR